MKISQIQIKKMWGKQDIEWNHVDPKVNILVGPNGSGKSTFLRFIYLLLTSDIKELNKLKQISLFGLMQEVAYYIMQTKKILA